MDIQKVFRLCLIAMLLPVQAWAVDMKHRYFWILFLAVGGMLSFASLSLASDLDIAPVLTLTDSQTGNSAPLYHTGGDPTGQNFLLYANEKFEYTCWIPTEFLQVVLLPDNGDGLIVETEDGQAQLRVTGGYADFLEGGLKGSFTQAKNSINGPITLEDLAEDKWTPYWMLQGYDGDTMIVRKFILKDDYFYDLSITYPATEHGKYAEISEIVAHNFNREIEGF